jgi:hypothetical protein
MAQLNQVSGIAVPGGDIVVKNYSGSDIGAGLAVILDATNTPKGSGVGPVGVTLPASDAAFFGITLETIPTLKTGRVRWMGAAVGTASATVHIGATVMCDSAGKILTQTAGKFQAGMAGSEALNADPILVFLTPGAAKNA